MYHKYMRLKRFDTMPTSKIQKMDHFKKIRENNEISDGYKI